MSAAEAAEDLYARWAREAADGLASLAPALQTLSVGVSPPMARAAQATENAWRDIDKEFGLLTSTQVAERLGYSTQRNWASVQRKNGHLLGISRGGKYLYPAFQVDNEGPLPVMRELIELADTHDWSHGSLALWLCSPSGRLPADARPVDLMGKDPALVVEAAREAMTPPW